MASSSISMGMGAMSMSMSSATATSATTAAATSAMSMDMDMDMTGADCKISMLWNWYTVDACFISATWQISTPGVFAGSCVGVVLLVMALEFLRRAGKEYDRFILRAAQSKQRQREQHQSPQEQSSSSSLQAQENGIQKGTAFHSTKPLGVQSSPLARGISSRPTYFRPSLQQQIVRALFHMLQFAVAYFIMLLAMYFNGYIIICIIIGAFLGSFVFSWESIQMSDSKEEVTFCCG